MGKEAAIVVARLRNVGGVGLREGFRRRWVCVLVDIAKS